MATPKTKATRRPRSTRKAASAKPMAAKSSAKRSSAKAPRTRTKARSGTRKVAANGLPSWGDLASKKGAATRRARAPKPGLVEGVPTLRFALFMVAVCALFTLYVGHVYATQALAAEVQQLQRENHRLVLKHNRLRGEFDRMTSPSVILHRAEVLGLETSSAYEPTIRVETEN